jgi:hypothetical protein
MDALVLLMQAHCAQQPGFIGEHSSIVDAAFRVFLTNDNRPLTAAGSLGGSIGMPTPSSGPSAGSRSTRVFVPPTDEDHCQLHGILRDYRPTE